MGYDKHFIDGFDVPLPLPSPRVLNDAVGSDFVHHTRHSLLFSEARGLAYVTAHNIDGTTLPEGQRTSRKFDWDPKIHQDLQIGNEQGYKDDPDHYQRGHLARRASLSWGDSPSEIEQAKLAERESDYYTNIAPQERRMHVAWGKVEDWMLDLSVSEQNTKRACVFQGPVFTEEDPEVQITEGFDPVKIPAGYWKIVAIARGADLRAACFLIWQSDYATPGPLEFDPVLEQVRLTTIEVLSGLRFPNLRSADAMIFAAHERLSAETPRDRRRRAPSASGRMRDFPMRSLTISGPEDIII